MNTKQMMREIKEKGLRGTSFRFIMLVPRKFLGRSKHFKGISGKGDMFSRDTSWYRDDCKIPMSYVEGIELLKMDGGCAYLSILLDIKDIRPFVREMGKETESIDCDIMIKEYNNDI